MEHEPSSTHHDDEALPETDWNAVEGVLEVEGAAPVAASRIIEDEWAEAKADERTPVQRAYDELHDKAEKASDQGLDYQATLEQLDPSGRIRDNYAREEAMRQAEVSRMRADEIRKAMHNAKVAAIKKIPDMNERERAMRELLAHERADASRRYRRY